MYVCMYVCMYVQMMYILYIYVHCMIVFVHDKSYISNLTIFFKITSMASVRRDLQGSSFLSYSYLAILS